MGSEMCIRDRRAAGGLALRSRGVDVAMWTLMAVLLWVMSRAIEL